MVFSSLEFIFLFLPIAFACVCPLRGKWRIVLIFLTSLAFYAWGGVEYLPLMLTVALANFAFGILVARAKNARAWLAAAVAFDLLLLAFFKYTDPLLEVLGARPLGISLPIGISFYVFQALSYVLDVYRGEVAPQRNPLIFGTYVALFPQLIAGPIVKYRDIEAQLVEARRPRLFEAASGARTFIAGLCKKVLVANAAGELWAQISALDASDRTALLSWFGLLLYAFQIYFDFSGYSDMAIGLGKLLGFRFLENFNYPYISKSITEFWRRWHISLSSWFRDYLYIPLGGNRKGRGRTYFNLLCVWALTGLWHGASVNFLIWGLYYFLLLVLEKAFLSRLLSRLPSILSRTYALFLVLVGWLIFAFDSPSSGAEYLRSLLGSAGFVRASDLYEIARNAVFVLIAAVACTPLPKKLFYKFYEKSRAFEGAALALPLAGFALSVIYLVNSSYNPFLYFRF